MARQHKAMTFTPASPAELPRADRDVQDVSTGVTDKEEGAVQAAPLQPSPPRNWFARTWQHLLTAHLLDSPDEIVLFAHSPHSITVKLADGREYCFSKERL